MTDKSNSYGSSKLIAALMLSIAFSIYWLNGIQPLACEGMGDCVKYGAMTDAFKTHRSQTIDSPFNARILSPWLASILPAQNNIAAFQCLNGAALLAFITSWFLIARETSLKPLYFWSGTAWFLMHPLGFPLYQYVPLSPDPTAHALLAVCVLAFIREKTYLLWPLLFVSTLAKESFVFVAAAMLLAEFCHARHEAPTHQRKRLLVAVSGFLTFYVCHKVALAFIQSDIIPPTHGHVQTVGRIIRIWWQAAYHDPYRFAVWIAAFFCATGLFSVFALRRIPSLRDLMRDRLDAFLLTGSIGYIFLGLLAGTDMSRIIFNGSLILLLFAFRQANKSCTDTFAWTVTMTSVFLASIYTKYFPSAIEYHYYYDKTRIVDLLMYAGLYVVLVLTFYQWALKSDCPSSSLP